MYFNLFCAFTGKIIMICAVSALLQWAMRMITFDWISLYIFQIQDHSEGHMIMYVYSVNLFLYLILLLYLFWIDFSFIL